MIWSHLSPQEKTIFGITAAGLGASLYCCELVIEPAIIWPVFGFLLFFVLNVGVVATGIFTLAHCVMTLFVGDATELSLLGCVILLGQAIFFSLAIRFIYKEKYIVRRALYLLLIVSLSLFIAMGMVLFGPPIVGAYPFILGIGITQSFFLGLLYSDLMPWTVQQVISSICFAFVVIASLLYTPLLGLVFVAAYLVNYFFRGMAVILVSLSVYAGLALIQIQIPTHYSELLSFLSIFILFLSVFKSEQIDSPFPVDVHWLAKETESVIHEIAEYKQLANIINYSGTAAFLWHADEEREIAYVSENTLSILGYTPSALLGKCFCYNSIIFADDKSSVLQKIRTVIEQGQQGMFELEYRIVTDRNEIEWVVERSLLKENEEEEMLYIQGTVVNITQQKNAEERLHQLTYFDDLTGSPNRVAFIHKLQSHLEGAQQEQSPFAVLHIDIDYFKQVNENFGYQWGDQIMKLLAKRLEQFSSQSGTFLARMGNDNFNMMLRDTERLEQFAEQLLKIISEPVEINQRFYTLTASIGVSLFPEHGQDVNQLIAHADLARYQAKQFGNNHFMLYQEAEHSLPKKNLQIISDLQAALEQDQFQLLYQPKVDLVSGRPVGVEALLRWQHPEQGLITPDQFIAEAESSGLIVELTAEIIRRACLRLRKWQGQGIENIVMAVNLSARQFWDPAVVGLVADILEESKIAPEYLELEVTESMVMRDPEQNRALMHDFKRLGVRIAVDDFGVGQSSLHQLKYYPFDTIKIDRGFIYDVPDNEESCAIVKAIIDMGHSMNKLIISEGVETQEQADFLTEYHCDQGQGYYFSKPLTAKAFMSWYKSFM